MSVFGEWKHGGQVEDAVIATLKLWLPTYLRWAESEEDLDADVLPAPKTYDTVPDRQIRQWPNRRFPGAIVMSPGLAGEPVRVAQSSRATWAVSVAIVVSSSSERDTRRLAHWYGAAVRQVLEQKPSLGGVAVSTQWQDEQSDLLDEDDRRTVQGVEELFHVEMANVVDLNGGPLTPDPDPDDPAPEWSEVVTTDVDIEVVEEVS